MEDNKKMIDFNLPEERSATNVIYDILEDNGLGFGEDPNTWPDINEESPLDIARNAAIIIFQKKIPEDKLTEVMTKHLKCSTETSQKIIREIKENVVPYIKEVSAPEIQNEALENVSNQESIIEKVKQGPEEIIQKLKEDKQNEETLSREEIIKKIKQSIPDDNPIEEEPPAAQPPEPIKKVE